MLSTNVALWVSWKRVLFYFSSRGSECSVRSPHKYIEIYAAHCPPPRNTASQSGLTKGELLLTTIKVAISWLGSPGWCAARSPNRPPYPGTKTSARTKFGDPILHKVHVEVSICLVSKTIPRLQCFGAKEGLRKLAAKRLWLLIWM